MKSSSSNANSVGGIIGYAGGTLTCSQCVNNGDISGYLRTYAVGGIAGTLIRGTIADCINHGAVYSESVSDKAQLAGIANVGTNRYMIATVRNSYNTGTVTKGEGFSTDNYGGAVGYGEPSTNIFLNVYCTSESAAGIEGKAGIAGQVISEKDLKEGKASLGDNFVPDINNVNGGFPVLAWQDPEAAAAAKKDEPAPAVTPPAPPVEYIDLPTVKISKPKAGKKKMTVKWKKVSKKNQKKISGIQIQVATDPGFTNIVQTATAGKKKTSKAVKGLQPKTKYYVRIRAYAPGSYYSVWKLKSVKIK